MKERKPSKLEVLFRDIDREEEDKPIIVFMRNSKLKRVNLLKKK